ncbi:MAG: HMA2 domain-containing protein [Thermodesulfobacteriota bacterium]
MTDYLHVLDGRMRIKITEVKGSSAKAEEVTRYLLSSHGIDEVNANPITGNVLILYNAQQISQGGILDLLQDAGYLQKTALVQASRGEGLVSLVTKAVMETALQSMVMALI